MKSSSLIKFGSCSSEKDLKAALFSLLIFSAFGISSFAAFTSVNPASHLTLANNKQHQHQRHHQLWLASESYTSVSESDNRLIETSTNTSPTPVKTTTTTANIMHPKTITQLLHPKHIDTLQTILSRTIPPLTSSAHKGSSGRIAVLGGSEKYTGAPYYAAMSALRTGVDLASIFCAQEASVAIKSYSPELMVDSVYEVHKIKKIQARNVDGDEDHDEDRKQIINAMVDNVMDSLGRMHAVIIGPGLGRDPIVMDATAQIIHKANKLGVSIVLDADALYLLSLPRYYWLIEKIKETMINSKSAGAASRPVIVLTPNVMEYKRLVDGIASGSQEHFQDLLPGVVMILKGHNDTIRVHPMNIENRDEKLEMTCKEQGGLKRSGGIGDILAGSVGAFLAWNKILSTSNSNTNMDLALSCWMACSFTKRATYKSFEKRKRSMTAPDILEEIGEVVDEVASSTIQS